MEFDINIITRYLSEEATKAEKKLLMDWLDQSSHNRMVFSEYKKIWLEAREETSSPFSKPGSAFDLFKKRIEKKKVIPIQKSGTKNTWLRYVANILVILAVGTLTYFVGLKKQQKSNEEICYNEVIVPYGGISSVILPDKTKVWLHSGSKLKYEKNFGKNTREAYFDVTKNKEVPFIVKTSHIDILVTGTSFNVKSYPDDDKIETTLEEGSINIINLKGKKVNKPIVLKPNERFTFYKDENDPPKGSNNNINTKNTSGAVHPNEEESSEPQAIITTDVAIEEDIAWKDGNYVLTNETLPELAKILERRYNIKIHYNNQTLKDYTYSGVLKDLTLEQMLNALKLTSKLDYTIDERDVTLFRKTN